VYTREEVPLLVLHLLCITLENETEVFILIKIRTTVNFAIEKGASE